MNLNELKAKYIQYLTEKGELDDKKLSMLTSGLTSVFFLGSDFTQFVKENLSSLGLKPTGKIPNSISEILSMINEEDEAYDIEDEKDKKEEETSSNETTYNKDYSKNYIKNNYDKDGNLINQKSSVYSATGTQKSEYNIEFGAEGDVKNETQIEYGSATDSSADMSIGYSEQGEKGDCWLLATLNSLGSTDAGKEIIKNAITKNDDGSYSINFKGVNTSIKITQEELDAAKQSGKYAKGDDDVTLFELGFESVIDKIQKGEIKVDGEHSGLSIKEGDTTAPLAGGNLEDAIFLLTGKDVKSEFKKSGESTEEFDKILSSLKDNPDKFAALIGFSGGENGLTLKDIDGNVICSLEAGSTHAFSIKSVDEDGVTLVNPWDSSKEYKISLADARKFGTAIQYYATEEDFQETDTLDADKLDKEPTQSTEGTTPEDTKTEDTKTEDTKTDKSSDSGSTGGTGGGSYSPTTTQTPTGDNSDGTKDYSKMSLDELNTEKSANETKLKENQDKYSTLLSGGGEIADKKKDADEAYSTFKDELEKADSDLAKKYDDAKTNVDKCQDDLDKNDKDIFDTKTSLSAAENKVNNATTKITTIENSISALNNALSSAEESEKADIRNKIKLAEEAKSAAETEKAEAVKERDDIQSNLDKLNEETPKLEEALTNAKDDLAKVEQDITALTDKDADGPLAAAYKDYTEKQKAYEDFKASAITAAKEAITASQDEINKIDEQISIKKTKEESKDFSLKGAVFGENVQYTSKMETDSSGMRYLVIAPADVDPNEELPMLMYLHGSGEKGAGQDKLERSALPYTLLKEQGTDAFNFPQNFRGYIVCPINNGGWCNQQSENCLRSIVNNFTSTHKVDKDNIALSGHSMGGMGTIYMAKHMEDIFSRAAVISGYNVGIDISSINIPITGYVGTASGDSGAYNYMNGRFKDLVVVNSGHGRAPSAVLKLDSNNNGIPDYFEWLFPSN